MTKNPNPTLEIDIAIKSDLWGEHIDVIEQAARATNIHGELSIVLGDDAFIQTLNKAYRDKDKPTNVLSFPQDEPRLLGDIILAYETITREASQQSKPFEDHLSHLVVHGVLHLSGHDHEDDDEADEMEALEVEILSRLGIKNPYE